MFCVAGDVYHCVGPRVLHSHAAFSVCFQTVRSCRVFTAPSFCDPPPAGEPMERNASKCTRLCASAAVGSVLRLVRLTAVLLRTTVSSVSFHTCKKKQTHETDARTHERAAFAEQTRNPTVRDALKRCRRFLFTTHPNVFQASCGTTCIQVKNSVSAPLPT